MRRFALVTTVWLILLSPSPHHFHQRSNTGTLTLIVDGLTHDRGSVRIALSESKENYYDYANPTIGASAPIHSGIAAWQFRELAFGDYAIKAFHDENADGELDTNFLGIPIENYGFSNNASGMFGPPSWDDAFFRFESDTMTVRITFD